jgi:uncharacterized protein YeaO (DUF488 family)
MLHQATVTDIKNKRVTKLHGTIVVVTRFYPRFLPRNLVNEYFSELAPNKKLLDEFKKMEKNLDDHNQAFEDVDYESKFQISSSGIEILRELAASDRPVYLICHCKIGDYCHREILLLIAEKLCGAKISRVHFPWKKIRERIEDGSIVAQG